jgi:D-sedoheptulose 7-phosphate isomerase
MKNNKEKSSIYTKLLSSFSYRAELINNSSESLANQILNIAELTEKAIKNGNKILFCGNGGSAAEAQHMAAEYCATLDHTRPRKGMAAIALTTDSSFITAWTNDFGFEDVFKRQVETLGQPKDILMAYSTSGNSENILRAACAAQKIGITVILYTGDHEKTKIEKYADIIFKSPSSSTPIIQEFHTIAGHEICSLVEEHLL